MDFGEYLKKLRQEKAFSQQKLADMVYVNRSSITRWESGSRMPDAATIKRLAKCLDVDASELFFSSENAALVRHVIMVDDEEIFLSGGRPVLESVMPGATVSCFTKPSEALRFAKANTVSIAFLDIELGRHSGLDLCQSLLELDPHTNVIYLTNYEEYALDAWHTRACGYMVKPIQEPELRAQLLRLQHPVRGLLSND